MDSRHQKNRHPSAGKDADVFLKGLPSLSHPPTQGPSEPAGREIQKAETLGRCRRPAVHEILFGEKGKMKE
jgi:hypothetical protein